MKTRLAVLATAFLLAACTTQKPPAVPPGLHLSRAGFDQLPGWREAGAGAALAAFQRGCAVVMQKPDAAPMGGAGYAGTVADWRGVCAKAQGDAKSFFAGNFTPYAVTGDALFTGYYEPEIRGQRARGGAFQTPVYGLPSDLVRADLGLFDPRLKGEHVSGRVLGHALVPYPDRQAIETAGAGAASVLFYTDDPIAFFFLQIQGSGRVVFADGGSERIAYAGENGQPYTAIGRTLIADGSLKREEVSLQSIRAWLLAHPDRAQSVMQTDKSYVFFQEKPLGDVALGSAGSLGANLTPLASLAVDPRIHALGAPVFVAADGPDPVHALMMAQDTGGAIRGAARGDIFFGFGAEAQARAGAMKAPGRLYVLVPNGLAAKLGEAADFPP
ncbi:MAG TPA: MltA domain-containing protein [Rhizomicrobium sp.]|jgi:membrane-bound lytic murein transglycosylase A|nr:MltA domain-containing protein [Rhizomicrobium sp.]